MHIDYAIAIAGLIVGFFVEYAQYSKISDRVLSRSWELLPDVVDCILV